MRKPILNVKFGAALLGSLLCISCTQPDKKADHGSKQVALVNYVNTLMGADAYLKGSFEKDAELLLEALLKNASVNKGRPVVSSGREGVDYFNSLAYVPHDVGIKEIAEKLYKQSMNYKNVFDSSTKLMRGRNEEGSFQEPIYPMKWGDAFTEGTSLHYTWSVFHDLQGLIDLTGSTEAFIGRGEPGRKCTLLVLATVQNRTLCK